MLENSSNCSFVYLLESTNRIVGETRGKNKKGGNNNRKFYKIRLLNFGEKLGFIYTLYETIILIYLSNRPNIENNQKYQFHNIFDEVSC